MEYVLKVILWGGLFFLADKFHRRGVPWPPIRPWPVVWGLVGFYAVGYMYYNLARHAAFQTFAGDVTVYLQALSNWRLMSSIAGQSLLSLHFSPILYLFVPWVQLWTSPVLLFILHAAALALAAIPLFRITRRLGLAAWPGILVVFVYLNFYLTRQLMMADFHPESLMPLGIFFLIDLFLAGAGWGYWIVLAGCLALKEDMGFYLVPWVLLMAWLRPAQRNTAFITAGVAFVAGVASMAALLPAHQGVYPYFSNWSAFGTGLLTIPAGALRQPFLSAAMFFKPAFLHLLFFSAGLIVLTPWFFALLPVAWIQLASANPVQSSLLLYYSAPVLPFVFIALAAGWKRLEGLLQHRAGANRVLFGVALFLVLFNLQWQPPAASSQAQHRLAALLRQIPPGVPVLAQSDTAPHIPDPGRVLVLGTHDFPQAPGYVVFYIRGTIWPFSRDEYFSALNRLRQDPRYTIWQEEDGAIIFRLRPPASP